MSPAADTDGATDTGTDDRGGGANPTADSPGRPLSAASSIRHDGHMITTSDAPVDPRPDLPPPPPPGRTGPWTPPARFPHQSGWDRARDLAEWWYKPLGNDVWLRSLGYLFLSAVLALVAIGAVAVIGAFTLVTLFVVVGLFIVVPVFRAADWFVSIHQRLAGLAGHHYELRAARPLDGVGWRNAKSALADQVRWRRVGFIAANAVMAPVAVAFAAMPLSLGLNALFDWGGVAFGTGPIIGLPVAAICAGLLPRVAVPVANVKADIDAWFLGNDRLAEAQQRVSMLTGQREEILDAVALERRRIERNLHDGVQQQLVAIGLDLGMAESNLGRDPERARELIVSAREKVQGSIGELRQLGRGLHPAILEDRGLDAALSAVVAGSAVPINVHVDDGLELGRDVEEAVYMMANEAIANILKHAQATVASVHVMKMGTKVRVIVNDNGIGGASVRGGTGLAGMKARINAVDGTFSVTSPAGGPTTLNAEIPLP